MDTGYAVRVFLINDYGYPAGGAENIIFHLRAELQKRGHDVGLFTSDAGIERSTPKGDFHCWGTTGSLRTLLQCGNVSAWASLRRALAEFRPDVVHVNLYLTQLSPFILPCLRDVPAVYYAQWYRAICPLGTRRLPDMRTCGEQAGRACLKNGCLPLHDWLPLQGQRLLDARWRGTFHRVVAISRAVADKLSAFGEGAFANPEVIHAGTPDATCRTEFSDTPVFLFAGRLVPEKGCDVLLRAFAAASKKIPAARLEVIGDGPELGRLQQLAASLGIASGVDFRGALDNGQTQLAMRSAWAVCVPSVWEEPFGVVALEAQMNGVPVVASRCGGLTEIVTPESGGMLIPPGDAESLAEAMVALSANGADLLARGKSAHTFAMRHFRISKFADHFEKLYSTLVQSPNS